MPETESTEAWSEDGTEELAPSGQRVSDEQLNEAIARPLHHHEWTSGNFTHRDAEECWDEHDTDEQARWLGMGAAVASAVEAVIVAATREAVAEEIEARRDDCDQQALAHAGDDARSTATRLRFESMGLAYHRAAMMARGSVARGVLVDGKGA